MADMDPMSVAIGELTAEAKASTSQRKELFKKVDNIEKSVSDLTTTIESFVVGNDLILKAHTEKLDSHGDAINGLRKFKRNSMILGAGLGGTGGIAALIKTKLGM